MKNKEFGSEFHYPIKKKFLQDSNETSFFSKTDFSLFFSGRAALYNILKTGIKDNNWKRVYFPSYYCHEVVHFMKPLPIETHYYEFNPFLDPTEKQIDIPDSATNIIVNVNFFGLKKLNLKSYDSCIQIEDLTHNILGFSSSSADFCFGSLRKELPVPVGGFCYSPKNRPLPKGSFNNYAEQVALQKLMAMFLKTEYLKDNWKNKNIFRELYAQAENSFALKSTNALLPELSKQILYHLNCKKIIDKKAENIRTALQLLNKQDVITYNFNSNDENAFGLILECKTLHLQTVLKKYLVKNSIYPAVLWPNQLIDKDKELEHRMLFIHLDFRYSSKDIRYITHILNAYTENEQIISN